MLGFLQASVVRDMHLVAIPGTSAPGYNENWAQTRQDKVDPVFIMTRDCMPCPCFQCQEIKVDYPPRVDQTGQEIEGTAVPVGRIRATCCDACAIFCPSFKMFHNVKDANGKPVMDSQGKLAEEYIADITGPTCFCCLKPFECCCDLAFMVTRDIQGGMKEMVADINHTSIFKFGGFGNAFAMGLREGASDADIYLTTVMTNVQYPGDSPIRKAERAAMFLASTVLIDLAFFEKGTKGDDD